MSSNSVAKAVPEQLPWLDWLRFISALIVVLGHARAAQFADFGSLEAESQSIIVAMFFAVTRLGHEAVVFFFVLSGYLVGGRAIERMKSGSFNLLSYMIDRLTRIYIPLVPAIFITLLVQWVVDDFDSIGVVVANILGLQGILYPVMHYNGPLWSLSYEIWFYFLCGTAVAYCLRPGAWLFVAVALCFCVFTVLQTYLLLCWILGMLAYTWGTKIKSKVLLSFGALVALGGIVSHQFASDGTMQTVKIIISTDVSTVIIALGVSLVISQIVLLDTPRRGVFISIYSQGTILSAFSYTLYLVHYPIIYLIKQGERSVRVDLNSMIVFIALVFGAIAASYVVYNLFERHTDRLRRLFRRRIADIV